jgi:hypothetical protein
MKRGFRPGVRLPTSLRSAKQLLNVVSAKELFDHRPCFVRVLDLAYDGCELAINPTAIASRCTSSMPHAVGHLSPARSICLLIGVLFHE